MLIRSVFCDLVVALTSASTVEGQDREFGDAPTRLDAWTFQNVNARSRDAVLEVRSGKGWARAEPVVADFELTLEVRLGDPDTQALVYLRAWPTFDKSEAPDNHFRLTLGPDRALSAWRRLRIECVGRTVKLFVEGKLAYTGTDVANPQGYIAFGTLKGTSEFRDIAIRRFAPP